MQFADFVRWIMLFFLILGGLDACVGNRFGLGDSFRQGFMTMGPLILAMTGMNTVAPLLADLLSGALTPVFQLIGADASMLSGMLLCNDSGGYAFAMNIASDSSIGGFAGAVVCSICGVTLSFTIPLAFSSIKAASARANLSRGLLIGIGCMPAGCFIGGIVCGISMIKLIMNLLPLTILAGILFFCLLRFPNRTVKVMGYFGKGMSAFLVLTLILSVFERQTDLRLFGGRLVPFTESLTVIGDICIVLAGAFPLLELLKRVLAHPLEKAGKLMNIDSSSVTGLFTTLINNIPVFGSFESMDERGQVLNAAFAVSASFALGDHLGFTSGACPEYLAPMLAAKICGGFIALSAALLLTRKHH